jgi:hypothetical protein
MVQKLAKRNHIHTLEYSSRSKLCGLSLNSSEGRDSVADLKTFANNSEEAFGGGTLYISVQPLLRGGGAVGFLPLKETFLP